MSNGDKNFEEYLDGKSRVSEKYAELRDVDPPTDLDAVILAEAGRAAKEHSHSAGTRRWVIPLSVAATVMICFSLVLNILREVPSGIGTQPAVDALIPGDSFDEERSIEVMTSTARRALPGNAANPAMQDSAGRPADADTAFPGKSVMKFGESEVRDDRPLPKEEGAPGPAGGPAPLAAVPPSAAVYARPETPAALDTGESRPLEADELMVLGQMMGVVEDHLHPEPEATELEELRVEMESPVDADRLLVRKSEVTMLSGLASSIDEKQSGRPGSHETQTEAPDSRLQRIVDLYEQGENIAAAQALDEFRQAFPDHPVSRLLLERGY